MAATAPEAPATAPEVEEEAPTHAPEVTVAALEMTRPEVPTDAPGIPDAPDPTDSADHIRAKQRPPQGITVSLEQSFVLGSLRSTPTDHAYSKSQI